MGEWTNTSDHDHPGIVRGPQLWLLWRATNKGTKLFEPWNQIWSPWFVPSSIPLLQIFNILQSPNSRSQTPYLDHCPTAYGRIFFKRSSKISKRLQISVDAHDMPETGSDIVRHTFPPCLLSRPKGKVIRHDTEQTSTYHRRISKHQKWIIVNHV